MYKNYYKINIVSLNKIQTYVLGETMVKAYLESYQNELLQKKMELEIECNHLENEVKEIMQSIIELEKEDKGISSLLYIKNYFGNDKKIKALEQKQEQLQKQALKTEYELNDINGRLAELSGIIRIAKQNEISRKELTSEEFNNDVIRLKFLETQELERQRIARDLHDSTVQSLTGIIYKTEFCTKLMDIDANKCKSELTSMSKTLHEIINEMRELIYNLRPMSYDDMGLNTTIEREISKLENIDDINIHYNVEGNINDIKSVISLTVLRVIQEACNNIVKHAEAKNVYVNLHRNEDELIVTIEDDGKGFDIKNLNSISKDDYSGFGLSMMHERVFLLSGEIEMQSEINKGTKIKVKVPLNH